jgi:hypothetical protein
MRQLHLLKPSMSEKLTPRRSLSPETKALIVGWVYGFCAGVLAVISLYKTWRML